VINKRLRTSKLDRLGVDDEVGKSLSYVNFFLFECPWRLLHLPVTTRLPVHAARVTPWAHGKLQLTRSWSVTVIHTNPLH